MAYTWANRVKFIVRYMYDIDNNGLLDRNDFECLALKSTIVEGKGEFEQAKYEANKKIMLSLWEEIAELADFNKDGEVTCDEFKQAVQNVCVGKTYEQFPNAMKAFIESRFKSIDVDGDGLIGLSEYRVDCVQRQAYKVITDIDEGYSKLCTEDDKTKGGIDLARYKVIFAEFLGSQETGNSSSYLFGPLNEL